MANNDKDKVVEFESLELEEEGTEEGPSKMETLLSFVKSKLSEDDYSELQKELGIEGSEMSNEELFAQIKALFEGAKPEEEEEDPDKKKDDETDMMDQQKFMEECLGSGKSREECLEEFKKKMPEEKSEEGAPEEESELAGKVEELTRQLAELKNDKDLAAVTASVDKLIVGKHLAPVQKDMAIKLASGLDAETRDGLYNFWEKTQKFNVSKDVGLLESNLPGVNTGEITAERREYLLEKSGLKDLIRDKADKTKLPWKVNN